MSATKPIIIHHRQINPSTGEVDEKGGATIAYIIDGDNIVAGFSVCSKKDNYVKKAGAAKAIERIDGGQFSFTVPKESLVAQIKKDLTMFDFATVVNKIGIDLLQFEHFHEGLIAEYLIEYASGVYAAIIERTNEHTRRTEPKPPKPPRYTAEQQAQRKAAWLKSAA